MNTTETLAAPLKDHEIAKLVNDLREVAVEFHGAQQLRERIAHLVVPALRAQAAQGVPDTLEQYDPNISWSTHTFEITYQQWDYKTTVTVDIGGNCNGFRLFESAIDEHAYQLFKAQGEFPNLVLRRPSIDGDGEDTLECPPGDGSIERWLQSMCVGIRTIKHIQKASA